MIAIDFPEANMTFTKPVSMDDSECLPLSVYVGVDKNNSTYINSVWMPNKMVDIAFNKLKQLAKTMNEED